MSAAPQLATPSTPAFDRHAAPAFDRHAAFSRTLGYVTPEEGEVLNSKKVAIAGMGGVGGLHLQTLTRLGIGNFHIADFDHFEIHNFNRQAGASMSTINQPKCAVMASIARDINPELNLTIFNEGVTADNLDAFLDGVDLYVDGLDFFAFSARAMVFSACEKKGIPVITVAPVGMSAALMIFMPGGMTFEEYFRWQGQDDFNKALRMAAGIAPKGKHISYLVWPDAVDFINRKAPSTPMACNICAGIAGTEALKILLKRGRVLSAPHSMVYDAYLNQFFHQKITSGVRHPMMRLRLRVMKAMIKHNAKQKAQKEQLALMGSQK